MAKRTTTGAALMRRLEQLSLEVGVARRPSRGLKLAQCIRCWWRPRRPNLSGRKRRYGCRRNTPQNFTINTTTRTHHQSHLRRGVQHITTESC